MWNGIFKKYFIWVYDGEATHGKKLSLNFKYTYLSKNLF